VRLRHEPVHQRLDNDLRPQEQLLVSHLHPSILEKTTPTTGHQRITRAHLPERGTEFAELATPRHRENLGSKTPTSGGHLTEQARCISRMARRAPSINTLHAAQGSRLAICSATALDRAVQLRQCDS
jgi:hypothetical protein